MTIGLGEVHDCIANPLKLRIIMLLARNGPMSAKRIQTETGAPQTSLYRALNGMQEEGIIEVASETKDRAVTERAYDLSIDFRHFDVDAVRNNDVHGYCSMFSSFSLGLIRDFQEYAEDENADLSRDSTGFASVGLYLTDEEARMLSWRMVELIEPFLSRRSQEQRLHTMALVLTPPQRREAVSETGASTMGVRITGGTE